MTNFATILNDLAASFEGRNEYISRLCSYPLLILDGGVKYDVDFRSKEEVDNQPDRVPDGVEYIYML